MASNLTDRTASSKEAYDDRPLHSDGLPPEQRAPLAPFAGEAPPAPDWFKWAVAQEPARSFVVSGGTKIETLTWGEQGKPGLLLVHGNSAHADWWSPLAPYLAQDYRVTAMSLAGMGDSGWREQYRFEDFADDADAVSRATGLYDGGRKPVYVGHSFGGAQVFFTAAYRPELMHAAVLVDSGFGGPPPAILEQWRKRREGVAKNPGANGSGRVYPTLAEALGRFRLMPPQPAENHYILDFIARRSLKRAPLPDGETGPDGSREGYAWKFDPDMWEKLDRTAMAKASEGRIPALKTPMVHFYGDMSRIVQRRVPGEPSAMPADVQQIEIADSHHHVLIDQPLALVAALRTLLVQWPH